MSNEPTSQIISSAVSSAISSAMRSAASLANLPSQATSLFGLSSPNVPSTSIEMVSRGPQAGSQNREVEKEEEEEEEEEETIL